LLFLHSGSEHFPILRGNLTHAVHYGNASLTGNGRIAERL
jgi:hypothetical protein